MPNGIDVGRWSRSAPRAPVAPLVPLSTLLRPPELAAQLHTAGVEHLVVVPTFRGRDYLADLARDLRGPRPRDRALRRRVAPAPFDRRVGSRSAGPDRRRRRPGGGRRARRGDPARRRPRDHLHVGQPGPSQGRDPHPRRRARCHRGRARRCGVSVATTASTSRCRSSGWAASAPACCRRWSPGPRCSPKRCPNRRAPCALLERERVTLFRGWPDQAAALARGSSVRRRRPRLAAPRQPRRRPPGRAPRAAPARGRTSSA